MIASRTRHAGAWALVFWLTLLAPSASADSDNVFSSTLSCVITEIIDATGDGSGNTLDYPTGIAVSAAGTAYVMGANGGNAFEITPAGVISEIIDATGDGAGNPLIGPYSGAVDGADNVYVPGVISDNAFEITPAGAITEIIDATGDGTGNTLDSPNGIAVDGSSNVYVVGSASDNAFRITPAGGITEIIDATGDGLGNALDEPSDIAVDGAGNAYLTGKRSNNAFEITPTGVITEIIDGTGDGLGNTLLRSGGIAVDGSGNVFLTGALTDNAFKITPGGAITQIIDANGDGMGNPLDQPYGIGVDGAGNVYLTGEGSDNAFRFSCPDEIPPSDPTVLESTTHTLSAWSRVQQIGVEWSGAADSGGSGLAGYSVLFDTAAATIPDAVVDVFHTADPHSTTSGTLPEGQSHYFHLSTCDGADNCTSTVHLGPYWIDATPPGAVSDLVSTSHAVGTPSTQTTVDLSWSAAVDTLSGTVGYGLELDGSATWSCDEVQDTTEITASYGPLADGGWYLHICAVDAAGNWGPVVSAGPYVVDTTAPRVAVVDSVSSTADGVIVDGELVDPPLTQLYVGFDEEVTGAASTASYLVFERGANGAFDTADCATGITGDDVSVTLQGALYDSQTGRVDLSVSEPLPRGRYRLHVCGSTTIDDLAGNPLDGDGDGTGGDDHVLGFWVSENHLIANPNFDETLASWETIAPSPSGWTTGADSDGAPTSESAWVDKIGGTGTGEFVLEQCLWVTGDQGYFAGGRVRVDSTGSPDYELRIVFTDSGPSCTGVHLGEVTPASSSGDTGGSWPRLAGWFFVPAGIQALDVEFVFDADTTSDFAAFVDSVFLSEMLFGDGFERGDTTGWSAVAP